MFDYHDSGKYMYISSKFSGENVNHKFEVDFTPLIGVNSSLCKVVAPYELLNICCMIVISKCFSCHLPNYF